MARSAAYPRAPFAPASLSFDGFSLSLYDEQPLIPYTPSYLTPSHRPYNTILQYYSNAPARRENDMLLTSRMAQKDK